MVDKRRKNRAGAHEIGVEIARRLTRGPAEPGGIDVVGPFLEGTHRHPSAPEGEQQSQGDERFAGASGHAGDQQARKCAKFAHDAAVEDYGVVPSLGGSWMKEPPKYPYTQRPESMRMRIAFLQSSLLHACSPCFAIIALARSPALRFFLPAHSVTNWNMSSAKVSMGTVETSLILVPLPYSCSLNYCSLNSPTSQSWMQ